MTKKGRQKIEGIFLSFGRGTYLGLCQHWVVYVCVTRAGRFVLVF